MIDATTFLDAAFPSELVMPGDTVVVGHPAHFTDDEGVRRDYYKKYPLHVARDIVGCGGRGWVYHISTVKMPAGANHVRGNKETVSEAFVLPLDDIGTKSKAPAVEPSYVLETSQGNFQWGYFIDPYEVDYNSAGARYFDGCLLAMANAGFNDVGNRGVSRMVKLPGAVHAKTGFVSRVVDWHPDRVWSLKSLMKAFGIKAQRINSKSPDLNTEGLPLALVEDPVLDWLSENGWLRGGGSDSFVNVVCPWSHEHSGFTGDGESGYSPLDYHYLGRQFKCLHGHCSGRGFKEFADVLRRFYDFPYSESELGNAMLNSLQSRIAALPSIKGEQNYGAI